MTTPVACEPEAEAAICAILIEPSSADTLLPIVRKRLVPEHFQTPDREKYRSILIVAASGVRPDKANVVADLRSRNKLDDVGGPEAVRVDVNLSNDPVTIAGHVDAILEAYTKREIESASREAAIASRNGKPSAEIIERLRERIDQIGRAGAVDNPVELIEHTVLFARGVPAITYDVEGLIASDDGPVLVYGDPESGKSAIMLHIGACRASGDKVFGEFAVSRRTRSICLNLDAGAKPFARRALMVGCAVEGFAIASPPEFTVDELRAVVAANPGAFISVDCFAELYRPDPAAEQGADMRAFVRAIRALYEKHGCNGLWIDHANRSNLAASERFYGSIQKRASFRQMWVTERVRVRDEREGRMRVKITCVKQSEAEKFASFFVDLEWVDGECRVHYAGIADEAASRASHAAKDAEIVLAVLTKAGAPLRRAQIESETGLPRDRVRAALNDDRFGSIGPERSPKRAYFVRDMVVEFDLGDEL